MGRPRTRTAVARSSKTRRSSIGGHANRAIAIDQIEAYGGGGNMLFVFVEASGVMVKGNVVELSGVNTSASSTSRGETK